MCADSYYYCNCALARANALRGMYTCMHIKRFVIYASQF